MHLKEAHPGQGAMCQESDSRRQTGFSGTISCQCHMRSAANLLYDNTDRRVFTLQLGILCLQHLRHLSGVTCTCISQPARAHHSSAATSTTPPKTHLQADCSPDMAPSSSSANLRCPQQACS